MGGAGEGQCFKAGTGAELGGGVLPLSQVAPGGCHGNSGRQGVSGWVWMRPWQDLRPEWVTEPRAKWFSFDLCF